MTEKFYFDAIRRSQVEQARGTHEQTGLDWKETVDVVTDISNWVEIDTLDKEEKRGKKKITIPAPVKKEDGVYWTLDVEFFDAYTDILRRAHNIDRAWAEAGENPDEYAEQNGVEIPDHDIYAWIISLESLTEDRFGLDLQS